ncbi:hypothetical protein SmphiM6_58 [Sinorhizobium phage phiM6]|nr:hypothetical protein SmphiM6_58 [Sinorhizobium phage phiM6]
MAKKYKIVTDSSGEYHAYRRFLGLFWVYLGWNTDLEYTKERIERDKKSRAFRPKVMYLD